MPRVLCVAPLNRHLRHFFLYVNCAAPFAIDRPILPSQVKISRPKKKGRVNIHLNLVTYRHPDLTCPERRPPQRSGAWRGCSRTPPQRQSGWPSGCASGARGIPRGAAGCSRPKRAVPAFSVVFAAQRDAKHESHHDNISSV